MELEEIIQRSKARPEIYAPALAMEALRLEAERDHLLNEIQLITAPHDSVGAVIAGIRAERDELAIDELRAECEKAERELQRIVDELRERLEVEA